MRKIGNRFREMLQAKGEEGVGSQLFLEGKMQLGGAAKYEDDIVFTLTQPQVDQQGHPVGSVDYTIPYALIIFYGVIEMEDKPTIIQPNMDLSGIRDIRGN